jgi:integrase
MNLFKRANRRGGFVWCVRWREGRTRRCVTLKGIESEKMARQAMARLVERRERGAAGLPSDPRYAIKEALDALVAIRSSQVKDRQARRFACMSSLIRGVLGDNLPVAQLKAADVAKLRQHLRTRGLTAYTINKYTGFLTAAAELAVDNDIIGRNPLRGVGRVSDPDREVWRALGEDEIAALFRAADGYAVKKSSRMGNEYEARYVARAGMREFLTMALNTGGRMGELLAVRWGDVDMKANQIRLITTKKATAGKEARSRYIPINAALAVMLKELRQRNPSPADPVLTINPSGLSRAFSILARRAGLNHVRVHDLRHTFCSTLAGNGVPIHAIKELAGHSVVTVTSRYMHLAPKAGQTAVDTLNFGATGGAAKVVDVAGQSA